jgi:DNA polymerase-3 subunit beta
MTKERKKTKAGGTTLSAPALKAALNAVAAAVPTKSVRPVLQNVLLSDGVLTGSDGEVRIDVEIDAPPGINFLLPKDRFAAILGSFSGDEITITPDATSCVITAGHGTWTLPTEDIAEYPTWEPVGVKQVVRLPADQFVRAVKGVVFAADNESSRFALGAVLIEVKGDVVTFVATDGRRLASVQCEHDQAVDDRREPDHKGEKVEPPLLVPARVMSIIARIADHAGDESVQLQATGKEILATIGVAKVTASLLQGKFPPWRDVIPERDAKPTTVARIDLFTATRAAAICSSDESKGVQFAFGADGIWLQGKSSEKGESSVTCEIVDAGDTASVKLDPAFVTEWLNGIAGDADPNVEVEAVNADSAVILRCGDNTGVIMPLAVDG